MKNIPGHWLAVLAIVSAVAGVGSWVIVEQYADVEAWDSVYYWVMSYPLLLVTSFVLSIIDPYRVWLWGFLPLGSQAIYVIFYSQGGANLFPFTVVAYLVLAAPALFSSYLGAKLGSVNK